MLRLAEKRNKYLFTCDAGGESGTVYYLSRDGRCGVYNGSGVELRLKWIVSSLFGNT